MWFALANATSNLSKAYLYYAFGDPSPGFSMRAMNQRILAVETAQLFMDLRIFAFQ
jgi:hypothetical protein